ncbi:MAG TPA: NAD(P)-dependent oxidoreductase, partial [Rectinemataceae bacterium]|nr:NAD(P)-dependent oxidoreductase [Rectinemataceae bacterium]
GVEPIGSKVFAAAAKLRVISRNGTGVDAIDLEAAKAKGIEIRRAEGANARGVAELAFGHLLSAVRCISPSDAALKTGGWNRRKGRELEGKTLGLLGCGKVGKLVARFALAFDMKIIAYDVYPDSKFAPSDRFRFVPLGEVIAHADFISLHCPPSRDGRPIIGSEEIAAMKKGVVIVNTARQSLVDERAMLAALKSGQAAAYTIDAFDKEPPDDRTIIACPNVIATPHIGGFTDESVDRATEVAVDNLLDSLLKALR